MKKKLINLLLTLSMAFAVVGFVSCKDDKPDDAQSSTESTISSSDEESTSSSSANGSSEETTSSSSANGSSEEPPETEHTHAYATTTTAPTCTEQGYTTYTCACGDTYVADYVNAKGHSYTNYLSDGNATYEADGTKTAICDNGCGSKDTITDVGTKLKSGISFKTLSVKEDNTVYGKVANGTTFFSFLNEITVNGNANYTVSTDITGQTPIPSKTVPVTTGDNIFYVLEMVENDLKLYTVTVRVREMYTVSFDTLGGSTVESQEVEEDSFAELPSAVPTKTGYTFQTWVYDFSQPITTDTTVRAEYTPIEYTITLQTEGGYLEETTLLYDIETATFDLQEPTRDYYTFTGWEYSGNLISQIPQGSHGNKTITAIWTPITYYVTYEVNGGETLTKTPYTVETESFALPTATRQGYDFVGWFTEATLENQITETTLGSHDDITLYAKWQAKLNTLHFVGNGNTSGEMADMAIHTDESKALTANGFKNTYYHFIGWATEPDGEVVYADGASYAMGKNAEYTLYAVWEIDVIYTLSNGTYTVTGLTNDTVTSAVIAPEYKKLKVTSIANEAFKLCRNLASIVIPDSVTSIGEEAFRECSSLTSVVIPDSVTSIGGNAFAGCNKLVEVINKSSLMIKAGGSTFGYDDYTKQVITDEADSKIIQENDYTFYNDNGTYYLLGYQGRATELVLPEKINGNGYGLYDYAFYNCSSLTSVVIPDGVTSIGEYAFYNCSSLTSIEISDSVTSIGECAFFGCSSLTNITIGDGVATIGSSAFGYCSSLTNIEIPNSVTSIGKAAFQNCNSLTSMTIPFVGATKDGTRYTWFTYIFNAESDSVTQNCVPASLKTVVISDSATSIGDHAFYNCTGLTSVTIPASVTSIDDWAFAYCDGLTKVNYTGTIDDWAMIDFHFEHASYANPLQYAKKLYINDVEVKEIVLTKATKISAYAFYNCNSLTSVTISNGVISIGERTFHGCSNLASVTIPNSVISIGDLAFYDCSSLTSIEIPNSVISIGDWAFADCYGVNSITIPDSVTTIGQYAFARCGFTSIIFNDTTTWYYTSNSDYTEGTEISVESPVTNATYFNDTYHDMYWYKEES